MKVGDSRHLRRKPLLIGGSMLLLLFCWTGSRAEEVNPALVSQPGKSAPAVSEGSGTQALLAEVAKDPANVRNDLRIGWQLLELQAYDEALGAFEAALKHNPRSAEAKTGRGVALARKGDLSAAEKVLREALVLNPNPVRAHYELGLLYQRQGDDGRAITQFKAAIEKHRQGRR